MNEGAPTPENIPVTEEQLVEALKEKGREDPEALSLLSKWMEQIQAETNEANTSRANVLGNIKQAAMYEKAGLLDLALDALDAAWMGAANEDTALQDEVAMMIERIQGKV